MSPMHVKDGVGYFCKPCLKITKPRNHSRYKDLDPGVVYPPLRETPLTALNVLALSRSILYRVSWKLRKTKAHFFASPHDGAQVASNFICVNEGCLEAFTMLFIGTGAGLLTLKERGIKQVRMRADLSLGLLHYLKEAMHPQYKALQLPDIDVLGKQLDDISSRAIDAIMVTDDPTVHAAEHRLEGQGDGASLLLSCYGPTPAATIIEGIDVFVHDTLATGTAAHLLTVTCVCFFVYLFVVV